MECPQCGTSSPDGARYCRACGGALSPSVPRPKSGSVAVGSLPASGKAPVGAPSPLLTPGPDSAGPARPPGRSRAVTFAVAVVGLAAVAVAVLAVVVLTHGRSDRAGGDEPVGARERAGWAAEPSPDTGVRSGPSRRSASTMTVPPLPPPTSGAPGAPPAVTGTVSRTCGAGGRSDCFVSVRAGPTSASTELLRIAEGAPIEVVCQVPGQPAWSSVLGRSVPVWLRTSDGAYVANVFVDALGFDPVSLNRPCL